MASQWFIARDGVDVGTATSAELRTMAQRGELLPTDHLWKEGMKEWRLASDFPRLFPTEETATVVVTPDEEGTVDSAPAININTALRSGPPKGELPATATVVGTATATAKKASASLKSAGSLIAKKAERTKIATVTLPSAYAVLGRTVYKDALRRDEFTELFQAAEDLLARRKQIHEEAKARPAGSGLAEKAMKVAADATALARTKAIDLEAYQAFTRLGEAVYEQHGSDSGPAELVEPITKAVARRDQLDREITEITPAPTTAGKAKEGNSGWLKIGGIAFVCLAVIGSCIKDDDNDRGRRGGGSTESSSTTQSEAIPTSPSPGSDEDLKELAKKAFRDCTAGMTPEEVQAVFRAMASKNQAKWGAFKKITPSKAKGAKGDNIINGWHPELVHWYGTVRPNEPTLLECQFIKDELTGKWALRAAFIGDKQVEMRSKPDCRTYFFDVLQNGRAFRAVIHAPLTGDPSKDGFGVFASELLRTKLRGQYQILGHHLIGDSL